MLVSLLPNSHPWNLAKELSWESGHWPVSAKYRAAACGRDRCKCLNNFYFQEKTRKKALHSIYLNLIVLLNAASTAPLYSCLWWRNDKGTSEGQMDRQSTANGQTACLGMRFQRVVYQHAWEGQEVQNSIATPHLKSSWRYWPSADPEENAVILYRWNRWTVSMIINVSKPLRQPSCNQLHNHRKALQHEWFLGIITPPKSRFQLGSGMIRVLGNVWQRNNKRAALVVWESFAQKQTTCQSHRQDFVKLVVSLIWNQQGSMYPHSRTYVQPDAPTIH